ncbi:MAG: SoxR reducing system RseC family protein [Bacillota bacterium]|nr:SoxR reducing system RseC family protein [Bacillota bacterium]
MTQKGNEAKPATRIGKVVREEKDGVMVRFERPESCTGCGACPRGQQKTTTVFALGTAKVGDIVSIQMPEGEGGKAAWQNYALYGLGFACGLLTGYLVSDTELAMVGGGVLGMVLAGFVRLVIDKRKGKKDLGPAKVLLVNEEQVLAKYQKLSTCPKATAWKDMMKQE